MALSSTKEFGLPAEWDAANNRLVLHVMPALFYLAKVGMAMLAFPAAPAQVRWLFVSDTSPAREIGSVELTATGIGRGRHIQAVIVLPESWRTMHRDDLTMLMRHEVVNAFNFD